MRRARERMPSRGARCRGARGHETQASGFTVAELLVAIVVVLVVAGGVLHVAGEAQTFARVQPEAVDVAQRARVGLDLFVAELTDAGAGASFGAGAGPLVRWLPPVLPFRPYGSGAADPVGRVFADRITVITGSEGIPSPPVRGTMPASDAPIAIGWQDGCPLGDVTCGLTSGQRIAVFDRTATFELATVRDTWPLLVQHEPVALLKRYREVDEARVAAVRAVTYYFDAGRRQVRRSTGPRADAPVLDEVVGLSFRYFGNRAPPLSPHPPSGLANCLFDVSGAPTRPVLPPDEGDQVELTEALLTDGPWCGSGGALFDADLYRVRRVRVTMRVQATGAWARGRDPLVFARPGTASSPRLLVPDFVVTFDVTPRSLQVE
jgi:type II secretory pathway pseudopilin PulG